MPRARGHVIRLSETDRMTLERWVRSGTRHHRVVVRSRIVLVAARGLPVSRIAEHVQVAPATVRLWCRRFKDGGIAALECDARGRGRRPGMTSERVLAVLTAMQTMQESAPTARRVATATGLGATTVWRVWTRFGLTGASTAEEIERAIAQLISGTRRVHG